VKPGPGPVGTVTARRKILVSKEPNNKLLRRKDVKADNVSIT